MMVIPVQVALRSKNPGDSKDYRVIAHSAGPLDGYDFEALFLKLGVGSVPKAVDRQDAPPWITCGTYEKGHTTYAAIIQQEWTQLSSLFVCSLYESCREWHPSA
jgi:hypothetical protein